jgi:RNA polymerase sigma-70 factor (ECF subfamily)
MTARRLGELIDGHAAALVLFARQWTVAAEDVVQDGFCKLSAQATWPDDPVAWLYRTVRNGAIDAGKADRRRVRREAAVSRPDRWFAEPEIDGLDAAAAVAALETLPAEQREVIVARLWGGRTLEQIAAVARCSVSTAHRRYEAGLAALRRRLGAPCQETTR